MDQPLVSSLPDAPGPAIALAARLGLPYAPAEGRRFPDGESYLRLPDVHGRSVVLVADLSQPNERALELLFLARGLREAGAIHVTAVLPYLPYMRQDAEFRRGEVMTSRYFAELVSAVCDRLVTVDPHLHRWSSLDAVYRTPTLTVSAAPALAEWVQANAADAILVGPDAESEQWVSRVAANVHRPFAVMTKVRRGDYQVSTQAPATLDVRDRPVVLVDDIASTGRTLVDAVRRLRQAGAARVDCAVVHGLFVGDALEAVRSAGAERIVSTNTVVHETNAVDVLPAIAQALCAQTPAVSASA